MTATTHPYTRRRASSSVRAIGRRFAWIATLVQSLRNDMAQIAAAGQLGPDPETEIGRQTGARV